MIPGAAAPPGVGPQIVKIIGLMLSHPQMLSKGEPLGPLMDLPGAAHPGAHPEARPEAEVHKEIPEMMKTS